MTYNLFLDDERNPRDVTWVAIYNHAPFEVVRSFNEFVNFITQFGVPAFVTFDHDLADSHYVDAIKGTQTATEKTGYDCAKWLVDFCIDTGSKFPEYMVHSMNPIGRQRIVDYIEWAKDKAGI